MSQDAAAKDPNEDSSQERKEKNKNRDGHNLSFINNWFNV
jgi:hypothetical protein